MFIEDGIVAIATRYHKGYTISGDVKIIHRYLPHIGDRSGRRTSSAASNKPLCSRHRKASTGTIGRRWKSIACSSGFSC